ncbi:MAG: T9SS type A sorting domain-containing protein, partial [Bacteroidetes bacterium]
FHAMWSSAHNGTVFIDPYAHGHTEYYVVYHKKDYAPPAGKAPFGCDVALDDEPVVTGQELPAPVVSARSNDGYMRQYRLALACTGEYATFHGGTKPAVLAAMVTSVNRINSVYEQEFAVTLQLIPNNDTLIFLDSSTDPYANNNGGTMLGQNQSTCDALIGAGNYDMGHVFSTGGGGIAGLGVVCTGGKARGVTGQSAPVGDPFDIDYVAHEMGHQFSGNHTQNNSCSRFGPTAMEPGSASTIMGYAGICAPNVQNNSDDYFHGVNVAEIMDFILSGPGGNCPVLIPSGNTAPVVSAGPNYTIPKSTPFALHAEASDPDSADVLTYCWEQMDNNTGIMPPQSTNPSGPLFRSFIPDTLPTRYFPRLETLVDNTGSTWERLSSVGRNLKFRVTVRDNNPAGGSTAQDDMVVSVDKNTGPFKVTSPNTTENWQIGAYQIIRWDVANSDQAPVSCSAVNIRLSTDGGLTYPVQLAEAVPNTGKYCLLVPDIESATARIMVAAVDNIFFDISDKNFSITPATAPSFSLCVVGEETQLCLPESYTATVSTSALLGLDSLITLSVEGLQGGATAVFTPDQVLPGEDAQLTIEFPAGSGDGNLDFTIQGIAAGDTAVFSTSLTLVSNDFAALQLLAPVNGSTGLDQTPVLYWQTVPDAEAYDVEVATFPTFEADSIQIAQENLTVDSLKVPVLLEKGRIYYWRVRPKNECGPGDWVGPFAFSTLVNVCAVIESGDVPKTITASLATTVESKITVLGSSTISDVNLALFQGNHQFFKDLEVHLISPAGTDVLLFKEKCGSYNGSFRMGFDDSGATGLTCPPSNTGAIFQPEEPLSAFNGENSNGDWILRVRDNVVSSGGAINAVSLEICANTTLFPPVIVNNNLLQVGSGNNDVISTDLLKSEDPDNSAAELVYTLMTVPKNGRLELFWNGELQVGAQFTQADLNAGGLRYFDYGHLAGPDQFGFTVSDGAGGMAQGYFHIQPIIVGVRAPGQLLEFSLAPNPATETVRLTFGTALRCETRVQLFDAAGRQVRYSQLAAGAFSGTLAVQDLPRGLYILAVDNAEGRGVKKLILNP